MIVQDGLRKMRNPSREARAASDYAAAVSR